MDDEMKLLGFLRKVAASENTQHIGKLLGFFLILLLVTVMPIQNAKASVHPNMYVNAEEIAAIKAKVDAGVQPWKGAYDKMMSDAQRVLSEGLYSVTFQGRTSRTFYSESPYCGWSRVDGGSDCRDGQVNPQADRGDYSAAIKLSFAMRNLGLAYAFTNNSIYAEKAISLIRTWAIDPTTSMVPGEKSGGGGIIELFITIPGLFYGADLVWNYPGWDSVEKSAFSDWVRTYAQYVKNKGVQANNFANWKNVLVSSAGALLEDTSLLNYAFNSYKALVSSQIGNTGRMDDEFTRTRGLFYSLYAINAMVQTAEIARHWGTDLYSYKTASGRGLELALDYHVTYALNPSRWPYNQILQMVKSDMASYELAYSFFEKPEYLSVLNTWGRPLEEKRVMGPVTLSHGNRFQLTLVPTPPSIIEQPASILADEGRSATFSVVANGSATLSYQWRRNGLDVSGATASSYTVARTKLSDHGAVYDCRVLNPEGEIVSNGATLTVNADVLRPEITAATAISPNFVNVTFSEGVEQVSAETVSNYSIDSGVSVLSAVLNADGMTVTLSVSPLTENAAYILTVDNIQDMAENQNTISPMSSAQFTYRASDNFESGSAEGWTPVNASRWSVVLDEGDSAYFLNSSQFSNKSGGRLGEYSLLAMSYGDFTLTAQAKLGDEVVSNALADYAVIFGFQDDNNYYYVMFNNDQNSTQLYKVVNGSRAEIVAASTDWLSDNMYHLVQVSRTGSDIVVRFDGNLIMSASDSSLGTGKVGVGSFNDSAYFDDVGVMGATTGGGSTGGGSTGGGSTGGGSTGGGSTGGGSTGGGSTGGGSTGGGSTGGGSTGGGSVSGDESGSGGGGALTGFMLLLMGGAWAWRRWRACAVAPASI